jgi:capsular exopolysaccharide synthesis family protein
MSVDQLQKKISVTSEKNTQILDMSVDDVDPARASQIANTTAATFVEDANAQLGQDGGVVSVAEEAITPTDPFKPNLKTNLMLALVLGLLVAGAAAMILEYLDDTVKVGVDLEKYGLTTIGEISRFRSSEAGGTLEAAHLHSRHSEAYRQLRTNIHFTSLGSSLKTIVVTSPNPGEGKSTTASNLAAVLAQAGDRVILVDADMRRSSLRKRFGGSSSFGLTGLLYNDVHDPSLALVSTAWQNLRLLPAGVLPPNPSELLTSNRMTRLIEKLRGMADYVIFDTPPVLAVTDPVVLAARTDGTILVVEAGKTRTGALAEAARSLAQARVKVGVVFNKAPVRAGNYYYYGDDEPETVEIVAEEGRPNETSGGKKRLPEYISRYGIGGSTAKPAPDITSLDNSGSTVEAQSQPDAGTNDSGHANGHGHNGHGNGHGHVNGSGNGKEQQAGAATEPYTAPLSAAVSDLLSHLDDTVGLIRSLRPGDGAREDQDL